ncbi:helix-turn-helix domain-containing protein [Blautia sp. NSJ-157]|uniref:helix-turn-helix domain-containing protein n=1 Tax=Blautia sp. NSJ-157 TaxID=2931393 RepID=UPI001FCFC809|nr:helix-turn-helix transcriptional regulator [Blautia sp. NSJ-157]MCJ7861263.1 helix-turn-helix domain-containing protein [Blautia sp. NSJ-157]
MGMSSTQKVGQEIKRVRNDMGLSQKAFGQLIGRSESQIGAYENATTSISVDVLFKIAEVAKIKPEELLAGPVKKEIKTGWDAELRVYGLEDRKVVMTILAVNGYDVGQHKKQVTPTGKAVAYYVHATDRKDNADTSK